jgi:hypothetical protein
MSLLASVSPEVYGVVESEDESLHKTRVSGPMESAFYSFCSAFVLSQQEVFALLVVVSTKQY